MSAEPYTPEEATVKAEWSEFLYLKSYGMKHVDDSGEEFDRFIADVKADAWDEGYNDGASDVGAGWREDELTTNPYDKEGK